MSFLEKVALPDIRVVYPWQQAPLGALLRVSFRNTPSLGMRCRFQAQKFVDALFVISPEEQRGTIVTAEELTGPGLDVSNLLELAANDPSPFLPMGGAFTMGTIYQSETQTCYVYERTIGQVSLFVCINGPLVGETLPNLPGYYLSIAPVDLRPRSKPLRVTSSPRKNIDTEDPHARTTPRTDGPR
jgi:hypothetical protein